jgi:hypothetical protein
VGEKAFEQLAPPQAVILNSGDSTGQRTWITGAQASDEI